MVASQMKSLLCPRSHWVGFSRRTPCRWWYVWARSKGNTFCCPYLCSARWDPWGLSDFHLRVWGRSEFDHSWSESAEVKRVVFRLSQELHVPRVFSFQWQDWWACGHRGRAWVVFCLRSGSDGMYWVEQRYHFGFEILSEKRRFENPFFFADHLINIY